MTFSSRAVVVLHGEGEAVTALGSRYRYKAVGQSTNGAYSLVEETLLDAEGPPLHVHEREEEPSTSSAVVACLSWARTVGSWDPETS